MTTSASKKSTGKGELPASPLPNLPEVIPKHQKEGPKMDYSGCAIPKPTKKKRKNRWGK